MTNREIARLMANPAYERIYNEASFWHTRHMAWIAHFFKTESHNRRYAVLRRLMNKPRLEEIPLGYVLLQEAETLWGQGLRKWALYKWSRQRECNGEHVKIILRQARPEVILNEHSLIKAYGEPKYTDAMRVSKELRIPYYLALRRLRNSSCRRKQIRRWNYAQGMVFLKKDVEAEMEIWRMYGHVSNAVPTGVYLREYDKWDPIVRTQWEPSEELNIKNKASDGNNER